MNNPEVAQNLLRFTWMPIFFAAIDVAFPSPCFSMHGGPVLFFSTIPGKHNEY